jgi:hypothetical protein
MSGEPMSTGVPATVPGVTIAEQYSSFAAYALSTGSNPRPASTSLDVARFHAYTGEITFSTDPRVRLYLDGGNVYHAEREGDPSIGEVLRDLGVVRADQLERGIVRVGDVEHLGRLFDREPSIDRDAVMVVMETRSEAIVREVANRATASVTISAYRHHPSGIHRWFVVSPDPAGSQRPVSAVAQVDRSVVDEIPPLTGDSPGLQIEWSDPDPSGPLPAPLPAPARSSDPVVAAVPASSEAPHADRPSPGDDDTGPLGEFHIRWPDGTAEQPVAPRPTPTAPVVPRVPIAPAAPTVSTAPAAPSPSPLPAPVTPPAAPPVVASAPVEESPSPSVEPPPMVAAPASVPTTAPLFSIAPLQVDELPAPDAAVPDDVAAAVKRALQAIENASTGRVSVPELAVTPVVLPELHLPSFDASTPATVDAPVPDASLDEPAQDVPAPVSAPDSPPPTPAPLGFAPPTPDMRAEAVYERALAAARDASVATDDPNRDQLRPAPGRASVVFVDDEPEPEPEADRRGALRRLISSLRHKDD